MTPRDPAANARVPFEPLRRWALLVAGLPMHETPECPFCHGDSTLDRRSCVGVTHLAEIIGTNPRTMKEWQFRGVPHGRSDRIAVRLGLHPIMVWGLDWSYPELFLEDAS